MIMAPYVRSFYQHACATLQEIGVEQLMSIKQWSGDVKLIVWIKFDAIKIKCRHCCKQRASAIVRLQLWDLLYLFSLQWRNNEPDGVSNHQSHDCLLNGLFRRRSKNISKLRVTGLCAGNSVVTGEFPAQMASNAENVSIWWRHHVR